MVEEIVHFRPGERIRRGGTVVVGEGEIVYEQGEKRETALVAFWCPDQCKVQLEGMKKAQTAVLWAYNDVGKHALKLTPCFQCGKSLVEKPKRERRPRD